MYSFEIPSTLAGGHPPKMFFRRRTPGFAQAVTVKDGFAILRSKTQLRCVLDGSPILSSSMNRTPAEDRAFRSSTGDAQRRAYLYFDRTKSSRGLNNNEFGATMTALRFI